MRADGGHSPLGMESRDRLLFSFLGEREERDHTSSQGSGLQGDPQKHQAGTRPLSFLGMGFCLVQNTAYSPQMHRIQVKAP